MASKDMSVRRVAMAKKIALDWLSQHGRPEYRLSVYQCTGRYSTLNLPAMLRSFRDGKVKIASVEPVADLGVRPEFDHVVLRSSDREGLMALEQALQKFGFETSGVF